MRDLVDRHSGLAVTSDAHDVVTELGGAGLWHSNILQGLSLGRARSDVPYPWSSPELERVRAIAGPARFEVGYTGSGQLGPYTDFELGMLSEKLSPQRWVLGSEWDFLDT